MLSNHFRKLHSCGNSALIFFDSEPGARHYDVEHVKRLLSQDFGVGGDNLLVARPSREVDYEVRGFNSDGSPVGMCANGIRCVAQYLRSEGKLRKGLNTVRFRLDGIDVSTTFLNDLPGWISVTLEEPRFAPASVPHTLTPATEEGYFQLHVSGETFQALCVSVGNPHCVLVVDELPQRQAQIASLGSAIENHKAFPEKTNVEFVHIESRQRVSVVFWERAVGITQASGSSSAAVFAALNSRGLVDDAVEVVVPGGLLRAQFEEDGRVSIAGPVEEVFRGVLSVGGLGRGSR